VSGVQFRHVPLAELVVCDICDLAKRQTGCVRVVHDHPDRPNWSMNICDPCAVEIGCIMIRAYFTPEARALEPPPEPKNSGGGT
jgi:hypothetical protein